MNFVLLTYPRTGSTVLQRVINTSSNFVCIGEKPRVINNFHAFVSSVYDSQTIIPKNLFPGIPIDDDRNPVYLSNKVNFDSFVSDLTSVYIKHILNVVESDNIGWKETFISPYPNESLANRQIKFLRRIFPDILFILNIRDPYQCSLSPIWQAVPNAIQELTSCQNWIINGHKNNLFGNNSILLDHNDWSGNPHYLYDQLSSIGMRLDIDSVESVLSEKLTHLSSVTPELSAWTKIVKTV